MDIWQILFNSQANTSSSKTGHVWEGTTIRWNTLDSDFVYQSYDTWKKECDTLGKFSIG